MNFQIAVVKLLDWVRLDVHPHGAEESCSVLPLVACLVWGISYDLHQCFLLVLL